jgi:hypothetical protein
MFFVMSQSQMALAPEASKSILLTLPRGWRPYGIQIIPSRAFTEAIG